MNLGLLKGYQLYAFIDRGGVWNVGSAGTVSSLSSAGAGVRFFLPDQMQLGVGFAVPVHYRTTADVGGSPRLLFSLTNALRFCPEHEWMHCL